MPTPNHIKPVCIDVQQNFGAPRSSAAQAEARDLTCETLGCVGKTLVLGNLNSRSHEYAHSRISKASSTWTCTVFVIMVMLPGIPNAFTDYLEEQQ